MALINMVEWNKLEYNKGDSCLTGWKLKVCALSLVIIVSVTVKHSMRAL